MITSGLRSIVRPSLVALLVALPLGCANQGPARIDATTAGMSDTREMLLKGDGQVDALVAAAKAVGTNGDYKKGLEAFTAALDKVKGTAATVTSRWESMKGKSAEYAKAWQEEAATLTSNEARDIAQARQRDFNSRLVAVQSAFGELKGAYDPFVAQMNDVRVLLANDLTAGGIAAAAPAIKKAEASASNVRAKAANAEKLLADMISSGATKAAPAPATK